MLLRGQSSSYGGCLRLEGYRYYKNPLNYDSGVYSCNIPDTSGKNHTILFGLYNNDSSKFNVVLFWSHSLDVFFL